MNVYPRILVIFWKTNGLYEFYDKWIAILGEEEEEDVGFQKKTLLLKEKASCFTLCCFLIYWWKFMIQ